MSKNFKRREMREAPEYDSEEIHPSYKIFLDNLYAGKYKDRDDDDVDIDKIMKSGCNQCNCRKIWPMEPDYKAFLKHLERRERRKVKTRHFNLLQEFRAVHGVSAYLDGIEKREPSKFKRRLVRDLKRPFDEKECEELMKKVTIQKPILKMSNLCSGKSRLSGKMGLSCLDHYPDLTRRIKSAERPLKLLLLRGFVFCLQNVAHEGSFLPWVETKK